MADPATILLPTVNSDAPVPFSDMTLVAKADGATVKVHRGVLAAHSRIFREIFSSCQTTDAAGVFTMPLANKTKQDLESLVSFMYPRASRREQFTIQTIQRLMEMGREYDMAGLTAEAVEWLLSSAEAVPSPVNVPGWLKG
jgi:hypothetical protein